MSAAERAQDARRPRGARRDATHGEEPTSAAPLAASVIVALNPHDSDPRRLFAGYLAQTIAPVAFEVIVADGGARPDFATAYAEHVRAFPDTPIRTIAAPARGRAAANNAGAQAARAELLIFVADDFVPCPTLVRAHVEFHRHRAAPAVGVGPAYFPEEVRGDPFCRWLEDSGQQFGVPFRVAEQRWPREFFYVGNVSLDRGLFERAGGFDPAFAYDVNDDYEFGLRLAALGVVSHFLPKAAAWHDHRLTFDERTEAMRRAGAAARQVEARHPERPAHPLAQQPLAALDAAVARTRLALARDATSASRGDYYVAAMNLAFARGYHESAAAPPPDPARS
jgi:GT2 family glycosyltransferase